MAQGQHDFFISYRGQDQAWAEWIAWQLEDAGYAVVLQAWDFRPGVSFINEMDTASKEARAVIAVLSPDYVSSPYTTVEWQAAYVKNPTGEQGSLIPVRVRPCEVQGLLATLVYIELVGLDEPAARDTLLAGIRRDGKQRPARAKPLVPPGFPGGLPHAVAAPQTFPGTLPRFWNVPFQRNPLFTGREELLQLLDSRLATGQVTALTQAISGLGGIGKTQVAIEYAYRYRHRYRAVLWVNAATLETLIGSYVELASLLELPEQQEQDQTTIVAAVKRWCSVQDGWVLLYDNADELALVADFLPTGGHGHLLLTTRAHPPRTLAQDVQVEQWSLQESVVFLLQRAGILTADMALEQASAAERAGAEAIARQLDGLPLALDQAGAYIEETHCRLDAYLQQYHSRQASLLQRRGGTGKDHPAPVATTWSLSFERVEQLDPLAADLLRCCAYLSPDAIPEQLLVEGAAQLGPRLQAIATEPSLLDEAMGTLLRFSLVKRDSAEQTITVHRLVQAMLRGSVAAAEQCTWAERTTQAVQEAFPEVSDYRNWPRCQAYLPHALECVRFMDQCNPLFPDTGSLLYTVGYYLKLRAQYAEAEPLYQRAIAIGEQVLGPEHPTLATYLNNLALLYKDQGKYEQVEPLYQRALAIGEQVLGPEHPTLATYLNNLASLYQEQGKYEQAEPLYQRAIAIGEQVLGPEHPDLAVWLNNLAELYREQGKYEQAEPLFQRAIAIDEQALGPHHPGLATDLNNLALLYQEQGKYEQAEPLYRRAIAIGEQVLGPEHPTLAIWLNNLALLYSYQGKYEQAEPLYQRAIAIDEQVLGPEHPKMAIRLNNLASLYQDQGKYEQAEPLFQRAIAIYLKAFGPQHPGTQTIQANYARLLDERRQQQR
jgi:tetratricopeptide (TPR) repeat protein